MKTKKRGGARTGAGAKLKYGEPITYAPIYVPKSKKKEIMAKIKEVVKEYEVRFVIENTFGLYLNHHSGKDFSYTSDASAATVFRTKEQALKHVAKMPHNLRGNLKIKQL